MVTVNNWSCVFTLYKCEDLVTLLWHFCAASAGVRSLGITGTGFASSQAVSWDQLRTETSTSRSATNRNRQLCSLLMSEFMWVYVSLVDLCFAFLKSLADVSPRSAVCPTFGKATLRKARICGTSACRKIMILAPTSPRIVVAWGLCLAMAAMSQLRWCFGYFPRMGGVHSKLM